MIPLEAGKAWIKLTNVKPQLDPILSQLHGKPVFDIFKLDEDISKQYPQYDSKACTLDGINCSMNEAIEKLFGKQAIYYVNIMCDL